jgi:hypothetical protein
MHLELMKGTKLFHYTRKSWGILNEYTISVDKNPNDGLKVLVYSNFRRKKIGNLKSTI